MRRRTLLRAAAAGLLAGVAPRRLAAAPTKATFASVNTAAYINPRMQLRFIEEVRTRTNGELDINWVGSGQLGGLKENLEAIIVGNLEFCGVANSNLGPLYPPAQLFDLPFLFRDTAHMVKVARGPIGEAIWRGIEAKTGIKLIMTGLPDGARSVWNSKRPVHTPADIKGLKLRVIQAPMMIDTFVALGAIPAPMASTDVYMAARQGVIDGAEWGPLGMIEQKSYEEAKYYTLTQHLNPPGSVAMNAAWFHALPALQQDIVLSAADHARSWFDAAFAQEESDALALVKAKGVEVIEHPDLAPFITAVQPVYEKYASQVGGWDTIKAVMAVS
jgi:tripartite ATP-independent transporter DctP family solute receptor